ncbi:MAG: histidinol-phosphate transaminase [Burkholderiales bacterium]
MSAVGGVFRSEITALAACHVQDAAGYIKLDAMENPFPLPDGLREGLATHLSKAAVNRYPDPAAVALTKALRNAMGIPKELDILLGNGSDEIIQMLTMACAKPGAKLLSVEPAFVMFKMIATFCGVTYIGVPLRAADLRLDVDAMLAAIAEHHPALTFLAYPNNPAGNLFDREDIRKIIRASPGLVVIDEAYFAFSAQSFLDEISQFPNVVLMRTVSKLGLAGVRLGLLIGRRGWLAEVDKVRLPYNINCLTQAAAAFLLENIAEFTVQTKVLIAERATMIANLGRLFARFPGTMCFPSEANFVLIRVPNATAVFAALKARKILVKNTSQSHTLMRDTLRITIGSPAENAAFLTALTSILESQYA